MKSFSFKIKDGEDAEKNAATVLADEHVAPQASTSVADDGEKKPSKLSTLFAKKKVPISTPEKIDPPVAGGDVAITVAVEPVDDRVQPSAAPGKFVFGNAPKPTLQQAVGKPVEKATEEAKVRNAARRLEHASTIAKFEEGEIQILENAFDALAQSLEHRTGLEEAVRHAMIVITSDQRFVDVLLDEDISEMVMGLREGYGTAIVKKGQKRGKAAAKEKAVDEIMADLDSLQLDIGGVKL